MPLGTILNLNYLLYLIDLKIRFDLQHALIKKLFKINTDTGIQILLKELLSVGVLIEVHGLLVNQLLYHLKLVLGPLLKVFVVNGPEAQLQLEHLLIALHDLIHLSAVPDEVQHQIECNGVAINKDATLLGLLQLVPTGEHGLEGAALHVTEGALPDTQSVLATDVQLDDLVDLLDLSDLLLLNLPSLLLELKLFPFLLQLGLLLLLLSVKLFLAFSQELHLVYHLLFEVIAFLDDVFATLLDAARFFWIDHFLLFVSRDIVIFKLIN